MKTGWPPGLLQDDCRALSSWFESRTDARHIVRKVCAEIERERLMNQQITRIAREIGFDDFEQDQMLQRFAHEVIRAYRDKLVDSASAIIQYSQCKEASLLDWPDWEEKYSDLENALKPFLKGNDVCNVEVGVLDGRPKANAGPEHATVPDGYKLVSLATLSQWKSMANDTATRTLKVQRHSIGQQLKQSIADAMN